MGEMISAMVEHGSFDDRPLTAPITAPIRLTPVTDSISDSTSAIAAPNAGFAELYRTHFDDSVRLARFLTGSWDEARDRARSMPEPGTSELGGIARSSRPGDTSHQPLRPTPLSQSP